MARRHATKRSIAIGDVYDATDASGDTQFTIIGYFDDHGERKWRVRWNDGHLSAMPASAFEKYDAKFSHRDFVAEPKIGHATKKSRQQLESEIAEAMGARPINKRKAVRHFSESTNKRGVKTLHVTYEDRTGHAITPDELARYRDREARGDVRKRR